MHPHPPPKPPGSPQPPGPPKIRPDLAARAAATFNSALERPALERTAFVAEECAGEEDLHLHVRRLLAAHEEADGFLREQPISAKTEDELARHKPEEAGDVIGHYKLREQIGEGGFGTVWVAEQEKPVRRRVALKIIKLGMDTREVIARFEQERQALAMMDHPNIAKVLDAGATQYGRPYFVMELVRGLKITDYCDEQHLSTKERIELFITVCQAVQHAHQKGIIHRDLKPSNILVTVNDGVAVPKVIDFGVAKATQGRLTDQTVYTQFQQMIGTPLYMSPEQAEMTSLDIDTRSDIYALGVLFYELLTGRTPIDQATMARIGMDEMRRMIREIDPPRPSMRVKTLEGMELTTAAKRRNIDPAKLPAALRGDLDWIVMKCLEKDRKRRYDTANGLALDLQRHLKNEVVIARPPTAGYLLSKLVRRHRGAFAAGATVVLALALGFVVSAWQAVRARSEATRAKAAEERATTTLDELRATAPAFAEQARALAAKEQFDGAIAKLDYALKLRPDVAEYLVTKGDLLQCQLKLAEAVAIYRAAVRLNPGLTAAEASARLCDELLAAPVSDRGALTRESLAKLYLAMQKQQRSAAELMPVARLLGEEKKLLVEYWLARLKDLPVSADRSLKERLSVRDDGRLALDLSGTKLIDLSPLAGAPLAVLNLAGTPQRSELADLSPLRGLDLIQLNISNTDVADLAPLREMHSLEKLQISGTKVTDLSALSALRLKSLAFVFCPISDLAPIRKMPLEDLSLRETRVADLSPLIGMPIKSIDLSMAPVLDFSPLAQLPLEKCYLQLNRIADLSVLRGKPLKELVLWGCADARNYAVISEMKTLELLLLPSNYRSLPPEDYEAIGALRNLPNLRQLGSEIMNEMGYSATGSKDIFWQDWDREQTFVPPLRKSGFNFALTKLPAGSYALSLQNQPLRDLSFLKNSPISRLDIGGCQVTDLTPLRDLPLEYFNGSVNPISDLSPFRGKQIKTLFLLGTKVSDLSPLKTLPLRELYLDSCAAVTTVADLAEISTLEKLTVPTQAVNTQELRKLPKLQRLGFQLTDNIPYVPETTAEEFWKDYGAISQLAAAGVKFTVNFQEDRSLSLTINEPTFSDLSLIKGGNISRLVLDHTSVSDLTLLANLPLTSLHLDSTPVSDLTPLGGLALRSLSLRQTKVTDLSVLRRAPLCSTLESLWLYRTKVSDFSPVAACTALNTFDATDTSFGDLEPLRGRKLREAYIASTPVRDVTILAGMPLQTVFFDNTKVIDVTPLLKCPTLKSLIVPGEAQEIEALRQLPLLSRISYHYDEKIPGPSTTAAEFWKDLSQGAWRTALRDAGIKPKSLKRTGDGTWELRLSDASITDLTLLQGAPISNLWLDGTGVTDLKLLGTLPLTTLFLFNTKVTDLTPLAGMKLARLNLAATKVSDISVLRGMPLKFLTLHACTEIRDLSPLADCKELTQLTLPPNAKDIEFLRAHPKLERLSFDEDAAKSYRPDRTVAEFWKEFDARRP